MDEATLDCSYCTRPATIEIRHQYLGDNADWRTKETLNVCDWHVERLSVIGHRLMHAERLVMMTMT